MYLHKCSRAGAPYECLYSFGWILTNQEGDPFSGDGHQQTWLTYTAAQVEMPYAVLTQWEGVSLACVCDGVCTATAPITAGPTTTAMDLFTTVSATTTASATVPSAETCCDGMKNGDEEGVDCGGSLCDPCPTCTDGVKNGDEDGVDCGGSCDACVVGGEGVLIIDW